MSYTDQGINTRDTGKATFPFLKLPAEVRTVIYHYHLTSEPIVPRHATLTKRWTPIDLLYVNHTIYNEAFFHLYTKGDFVLSMRPDSIFGLATCIATVDINAGAGLEIFHMSSKVLELIRNIVLKIHWPSIEYSRLMDRGYLGAHEHAPTVEFMLKRTVTTAGAMLSSLPELRTIDVAWSHMTVDASELTQAAPPVPKIHVWLRGLKQVRRNNQNVLVKMPLNGPLSTEELSRDQEDRGAISNTCREIREDIEDLRENLRQFFG